MSSNMYSGGEVVALLRRQREEVQWALNTADGLEARALGDRDELGRQWTQAVADLGTALLPQLDPAWRDYVVQLTGYTPFQHEDPIAAREAERARLTAQLQQIEADPRYAERELQRHPRTGTLVVRREELLGHRKPWADVLAASQHERLERLLQVGYGTEKYDVPFWRLSYYQDWEAADEILERFPGKNGFGEVQSEILRARETVSTFDQELAEIDRELAAGVALEQQHDHVARTLQTVDQRWLDFARGRVVDHVMTVDQKLMKERLASNPNLQLLYLRASGMTAKGRYLEAMVKENTGKLRQDLPVQLQKIDRDIAKFSRPKNLHAWWPRDVIDRRTRSRGDRYQKQFQRFEKHYHTVYVYDDWSRARAYDDFVWWYLMTDGRVPGHYIPEVAVFEQHHPQWGQGLPAPDHDDWDDSDAAAAIANDDYSPDQTRDAS